MFHVLTLFAAMSPAGLPQARPGDDLQALQGEWELVAESRIESVLHALNEEARALHRRLYSELENMIERLVIMCEGDAIDADLLPVAMVATTRASENHVPTTLAEGGVNLNAIVRELEGRMINEALRQTGGNKQAEARLLGLKRTTFAAKLRRCGVIAPAGSGWNDES